MLKFVDTKVVFSEIPDEITLAINISGCPCFCHGCHSSYLSQDIGEPLHLTSLMDLIENNRGITCVAIMGGDSAPYEVESLSDIVREFYGLKFAWYSGRSELPDEIDLDNFDYIKIGPFIQELGPLNISTTNQRLYRITPQSIMEDITEKLWIKF